MARRRNRGKQDRALYSRTNTVEGMHGPNTPKGWVTDNGPVPVWWYGSDQAAYLGTPPPAGLAAVSRATNLIAGKLAAGMWRVSPDDERPHRWLSDPTSQRLDGMGDLAAAHRMGASQFWGSWIRDAITYGMGYAVYERNSDGEPQAGTLRLLDPVKVTSTNDGRRRSIDAGQGYRYETNDAGEIREAGKFLLELRNPTTPMDPFTGTTPGTLAHHAVEIGLISAQTLYAGSMYEGGGVPSGYLRSTSPTPLTGTQAQAMRDAWELGAGVGRRTRVLSSTTEYHPVAVSPLDAAIVEMKRLSLQDVANAYGVPGWLIGSSEGSNTYNNVTMQLQALYEFTLQPWARTVEETLSALIPGSRQIKIEIAGERAWLINASEGTAYGYGSIADRDSGEPADMPTG